MSAIPTKYFKYPFASSGDVTPIPDALQPSGAVSYFEGFGGDYQKNMATDPAARAVPRDEFNQLALDITKSLQQVQRFGTPNYITPQQYGTPDVPVPCPYDKFALVLYDDGTNGLRRYQSLVTNNVALPSDATKWALLNNFSNSIFYSDAAFANAVTQNDAVYWDEANSRFDRAQNIAGAIGDAVGIADVANKRVYLSGYTPDFAGLTPGALYYLSATTPGAITTVLPSIGGVGVGTAISATELLLKIETSPTGSHSNPGLFASVALADTAQTITGSFAKILFNEVPPGENPYAWWDATNHRMAPGKKGVYLITGNLAVALAGGGGTYDNCFLEIFINDNPSQAVAGLLVENNATANFLTPSAWIYLTNDSDYFDLRIRSVGGTAGFTIGAVGNLRDTVFQVLYMGTIPT